MFNFQFWLTHHFHQNFLRIFRRAHVRKSADQAGNMLFRAAFHTTHVAAAKPVRALVLENTRHARHMLFVVIVVFVACVLRACVLGRALVGKNTRHAFGMSFFGACYFWKKFQESMIPIKFRGTWHTFVGRTRVIGFTVVVVCAIARQIARNFGVLADVTMTRRFVVAVFGRFARLSCGCSCFKHFYRQTQY